MAPLPEGLACPLSPDNLLIPAPSSKEKRAELLAPGGTCVSAHPQAGQTLSETEFCLNARKGGFADQNLKQINTCGRGFSSCF